MHCGWGAHTWQIYALSEHLLVYLFIYFVYFFIYKLYFSFMDLEKAFDRVPREVIRWARCNLGVEEWLLLAVMSMYTGAKTIVRTVYGNNNDLEVKVNMHQGSALSPLLFLIVMEALSREFRVALSLKLLYADDLAVIAETEDDLIKTSGMIFGE